MVGLRSAAVYCNLYADGSIADGIFVVNDTWGINKHIWWENRERGLIPRPLVRQRRRIWGLGERDIYDTTTSKGTRAWRKNKKLYQYVPTTPGGPIIY